MYTFFLVMIYYDILCICYSILYTRWSAIHSPTTLWSPHLFAILDQARSAHLPDAPRERGLQGPRRGLSFADQAGAVGSCTARTQRTRRTRWRAPGTAGAAEIGTAGEDNEIFDVHEIRFRSSKIIQCVVSNKFNVTVHDHDVTFAWLLMIVSQDGFQYFLICSNSVQDVQRRVPFERVFHNQFELQLNMWMHQKPTLVIFGYVWADGRSSNRSTTTFNRHKLHKTYNRNNRLLPCAS